MTSASSSCLPRLTPEDGASRSFTDTDGVSGFARLDYGATQPMIPPSRGEYIKTRSQVVYMNSRRTSIVFVALMISLLAVSIAPSDHNALAQTGNIANGYPTTAPSLCASGYSSHNLPKPGPYGTHLCMDRKMNCPLPGGAGVMYTGEYNFGGHHWYCSKKNGLGQDGPARKPEFFPGMKCSGFWHKIDCRGKWFPQVSQGLLAACTGCSDPYCAAFCAAVTVTDNEYKKQKK
jgi:hypothetical protein